MSCGRECKAEKVYTEHVLGDWHCPCLPTQPKTLVKTDAVKNTELFNVCPAKLETLMWLIIQSDYLTEFAGLLFAPLKSVNFIMKTLTDHFPGMVLTENEGRKLRLMIKNQHPTATEKKEKATTTTTTTTATTTTATTATIVEEKCGCCGKRKTIGEVSGVRMCDDCVKFLKKSFIKTVQGSGDKAKRARQQFNMLNDEKVIEFFKSDEMKCDEVVDKIVASMVEDGKKKATSSRAKEPNFSIELL